MRPIATVGIGLAVLALGVPWVAEARRAAPRRCPTTRVTAGASCTRSGLTCHWAARTEGEADLDCTCALDREALRWSCSSDPLSLLGD